MSNSRECREDPTKATVGLPQEQLHNFPERSLRPFSRRPYNSSRNRLCLALEATYDLDSRLGKHTLILMEAHAALSQQGRHEASYLSFLQALQPRWIFDTWISFPENEKLLGVVEYKWSRGEAQRALAELSFVRQGVTDKAEWVRCLLVEAAILCSCDEQLRAHACADEALAACESFNDETHHTSACQPCGIANFLHGKMFLAEEDWERAYGAFSQALHVPLYETRAIELKNSALKEYNRLRLQPRPHAQEE